MLTFFTFKTRTTKINHLDGTFCRVLEQDILNRGISNDKNNFVFFKTYLGLQITMY